MNEFAAFRVLRDSIPLSEEAYERTRACLDWAARRSGKPFWVAERALALYKLQMEKEQ